MPSPPVTAELEMHLRAPDANGYVVAMRFRPANSDADIVLDEGRAKLDANDLIIRNGQCGPQLTEQFFANPVVKKNFTDAVDASESAGASLRVRLFLDPAPEVEKLHAVTWELLGDPKAKEWTALVTNENVVFSRYLSGNDWRPVRLRGRHELRALIVVADPAPGARNPFAKVDSDLEISRARQALLPDIHSDSVRGPNTLKQMSQKLGEGYEVLYLVCHGLLVDGEAYLFLEGEPVVGNPAQGVVERAKGEQLVAELKEMTPARRPLLVVLASCQSSGIGADAVAGDGGVLAALGPRLAQAGIPAIIAMQGNIKMKTVDDFMPRFFSELCKDGQIDRAMAAARRAVKSRKDFWAPTLFLRLLGGGLWYEGFRTNDDPTGFEAWTALLDRIDERKCTPIVGPALLEDLIGSPRKIARAWAGKNKFPLTPHGDDDLYRVAQALAELPGSGAFDQFRRLHFEAAHNRFRSGLSADLQAATVMDIDEVFDRVLREAGACMIRGDVSEPHRVLSELPFPVYLTTNPDDLLEEALREAKRSPSVAVCPWFENGSEPADDLTAAQQAALADPAVLAALMHPADSAAVVSAAVQAALAYYKKAKNEWGVRPDKDHPLVYHLFGRFNQRESLVLTEDNYFDYMLGVVRNKDRIPPVVRRAMTDKILLFLGFPIDHWTFRALFQSLTRLSPGGRSFGYNHIAVQVNPEEGRFRNPELARRYLEKTFHVENTKVQVYWGRAQDFLLELGDLWKRRQTGGGEP